MIDTKENYMMHVYQSFSACTSDVRVQRCPSIMDRDNGEDGQEEGSLLYSGQEEGSLLAPSTQSGQPEG